LFCNYTITNSDIKGIWANKSRKSLQCFKCWVGLPNAVDSMFCVMV